MQKWYLMSILIMSVAIPIRQASLPTLKKAEKGTWWAFMIYLVLWAYGVRHIYWKLPE